MLRPYQVPAKIEQVLHSGMCSNEFLRLHHRFEASHPTLSESRRFMALFCPIIRILISRMKRYAAAPSRLD
jgi:surfactin synthase thioesterase subunit